MELVWRPLNHDDLVAYRTWFSDPELSRRASFPDDDWLRHVTSGPGSAMAVASHETDALIAVLEWDREDGGGASIFLAVDPARRGSGVGTRVLAEFLQREGCDLAFVDGYVEPNNAASLSMAARCGFGGGMDETDDEGLIRLRWINPARKAPRR